MRKDAKYCGKESRMRGVGKAGAQGRQVVAEIGMSKSASPGSFKVCKINKGEGRAPSVCLR